MGWSVLMKKEGLTEWRCLGDSFDRSEPEPASSSPLRRDSLRGGDCGLREEPNSSSSAMGGLMQESIEEELRPPLPRFRLDC